MSGKVSKPLQCSSDFPCACAPQCPGWTQVRVYLLLSLSILDMPNLDKIIPLESNLGVHRYHYVVISPSFQLPSWTHDFLLLWTPLSRPPPLSLVFISYSGMYVYLLAAWYKNNRGGKGSMGLLWPLGLTEVSCFGFIFITDSSVEEEVEKPEWRKEGEKRPSLPFTLPMNCKSV